MYKSLRFRNALKETPYTYSRFFVPVCGFFNRDNTVHGHIHVNIVIRDVILRHGARAVGPGWEK